MSRGGARNRSGPQPDESSGRSDARGFTLTALPIEGFDGEAPVFPLPGVSERELEVWAREWRAPVAFWWSMRPDLWADVALYVRFSVCIESGEAKGTDINGYLRIKDQIGRSPAGLKENGLQDCRRAFSRGGLSAGVERDGHQDAAVQWRRLTTRSTSRRFGLCRRGLSGIASSRTASARAGRSRCTTGSCGSR